MGSDVLVGGAVTCLPQYVQKQVATKRQRHPKRNSVLDFRVTKQLGLYVGHARRMDIFVLLYDALVSPYDAV